MPDPLDPGHIPGQNPNTPQRLPGDRLGIVAGHEADCVDSIHSRGARDRRLCVTADRYNRVTGSQRPNDRRTGSCLLKLAGGRG